MTPDAATPPSPQELAPQSVFGPYRIVRLLGRGGMGAVYEAEHLADGRVVALKLLTVDLDKMDARERFLREGRSAAAINHPNAVYIYGTEEIEGTPAITMELVPGGTLDDKVKQRGSLPWTETVDDILQVIDGLDAAQAAGILHRDVKPSNCFVGPGGTVKIGDFGLSKPIDGGDQMRLTQTGLFLGTPVFSSPEQLLGETLDVRSDIYAVGVTFYTLLTGELPYQSGSMMQVVASVLNGVPAPLTNHRQDLPQPVIDVVMKAMARKVGDRYQTYAEFREAVAALRVAKRTPATLWDRMRASIVDWLVSTVVLAIVSTLFFPGAFTANGARNADWRLVVISLVFTLVVVGIPEAFRGASLGKWLVGIRVIGADGAPPGYLRAASRILILAFTDLAIYVMQSSVVDQNKKAGGTLLLSLVLRSLLLLTARRHNGYRLAHDFATGTWVVRPVASTGERRGETARQTAPSMSGSERQVGPYVVLGPVREGSSVLKAWDSAMQRNVWLVPRTANAEETSHARRSLSRLTRLRWVGGRRTGTDAWDAFEAPIGEPIRDRLLRPVSWATQQNWLLDLSGEQLAAESDGTSLPGMSLDSVWVTPTDRLVFLESDSTSPSGNAIVREVFDALHASRADNEPLPRYATRTVSAASAASDPAEIRNLVQQTVGRPLTVTTLRRIGLSLATIGPVVAFTLLGYASTSQAMRVDAKGFHMSSLVSFVADSNATNRDSVRAKALEKKSASRKMALALESLGLVPAVVPDTTTPADTLRAQRKLVEVYLATVLRDRAMDTVTQSAFGNSEREKNERQAILARNTSVDSGTARDARILVDSIWKGTVPGIGPGNIQKYIPLVLLGTVLVIGAAVSLLFGLIVRRGPLMRGFQVDIVTKSGVPAGRLRILLRNIIVWSVLLAPLPVFYLSTKLSVESLATAMVATFALVVGALILAMFISARTPSRGLPERLSGTWLVPD